MHAPKRVLPGNVANRFKGNRHFDRITVAGHHAFRLDHDIKTKVFALSVSPDPICLHAERIKIKLVGFSFIVEGVKKNSHVVVVEDIVSLRNGRANLVGFVIAMEGYIEKLWIVAKHHLGRLRWRDVVARLHLIEILEHNRILPNFIIKLSIN